MSTKTKILSIAATILAKEGIEAVSIRYVCKKAGVKAPTVYYYFKDKDGLIDAIIALAYQHHIEMHTEFVKGKTPLKGLMRTWDSFFAFVDQSPQLYHAILLAHLKQRIPKEGNDLFESIASIFKRLEEKNKLKVSHTDAAEIFYAAAYGQALVYISQNNNKALLPNIKLTRNICLKSFLK